jgi:hypothetical protein
MKTKLHNRLGRFFAEKAAKLYGFSDRGMSGDRGCRSFQLWRFRLLSCGQLLELAGANVVSVWKGCRERKLNRYRILPRGGAHKTNSNDTASVLPH